MEREPICIEIGIPKSSEDITWLSFELMPGEFPRQWLAVALEAFSRRKVWGCRFGALCVDEADYRLRIQKSFERLLKSAGSSAADFEALGFKAIPYIPRRKLEELLSLCNKTSNPNTSTSQISKSLRGQAEELAKLVRHYIQIYHPEFHYHIELRTFAPRIFELPVEADPLFTVDRHDGWLYLDYEGRGLDAMAAYDEKNLDDCEPQILFSNGFQLLYRDNFEGSALGTKVKTWLMEGFGDKLSAESARLNVGLIPLAKPVHGLQRHVVRELFSSTEIPIQMRATKAGAPLDLNELSPGLAGLTPWHAWGLKGVRLTKFLRRTGLDIPVGYYLDGYHLYEGVFWFIKKPIRPFIFYIRYQIRTDFHDYRQYALLFASRTGLLFLHRQFGNGFLDVRIMTKVYLSRLWMSFTAPFHRMRPHAFNLYFKISRPIRKLYYFVSFQFQKRILGRGDKP